MTLRAVLIAGPTASGKSAVALALAERLGGTIVNADSMQVYAGLRVLTARPSLADESRAPHRLYGHVDPAEACSVGRWLGDVRRLLRESHAGPLIFVGGTGLYFEALTRGLAAVPEVPAAVRAAVRAEAAGPVDALHAELARRDPVGAARIRPTDRQRLLRALEVLAATGRPLSSWHAKPAPAPLPPAGVARLVLAVDRAELHVRIASRFAAMMGMGALDEAAALATRGLGPELPAMKALGVLPLLRHLHGEIGRSEAVEAVLGDTRRYAKRQGTWFRNRMSDWPRATPERAVAAVLAQARPHARSA
ncbi:MAG TPA: tRNA (adenosine(37)-N6)-dimethylallyltransferase MiaA [Hyphomicrobiales bacterium]|nr:tRNA (adenosine(37)-N6)-dimethylallyltransferase MiaA [Hyphomicrobiales bacterium]